LAAAAVATGCLSLGYRQGLAERAERVLAAKSALDLWRARFEADARRIEAEQAAVEQWVDTASERLSDMQARILQLEARARRLVDRPEFDDQREFDFENDPALGGPEDTTLEIEVDTPTVLENDVEALAFQIDDRWQQFEILEEVLKWRELSASVRPEG